MCSGWSRPWIPPGPFSRHRRRAAHHLRQSRLSIRHRLLPRGVLAGPTNFCARRPKGKKSSPTATSSARARWTGELVNQRRNGELYHVECTISPSPTSPTASWATLSANATSPSAASCKMNCAPSGISSRAFCTRWTARFTASTASSASRTPTPAAASAAQHAGIEFGGPPAMGRPLLDHVRIRPARRAAPRLREAIATGKPQENLFTRRTAATG